MDGVFFSSEITVVSSVSLVAVLLLSSHNSAIFVLIDELKKLLGGL